MFLLPFLLMMPISGGLYLLGFKGTEVSEKIFQINGTIPESLEEREDFFRQTFQDANVPLRFEYIREAGKRLVFRPSSRTHLVAELTDDGAEVFRVQPNFLKSIVELHKGHGPQTFKYFQMLFALGLLLITITGVLMGVLIPSYRFKMLGSLGLGIFIFIAALWI